MNKIALQYYGFDNPQPGQSLFHDHPRLTLRQAFARIARTLPDQATVSFYKNEDGIAACIHPHAGQDEPKLSYQFHPAHNSVVIRRIHAGPQRRSGLGSAMIAAQLPFWLEQGTQHIRLLAHHLSEGFYLKLGFERTLMIPEYSWPRQSLSVPMQLDLQNQEQRDRLAQALAKAPPLSNRL